MWYIVIFLGLAFAGVPISECEEDQLSGSRVLFAPRFG